MSTRRSLAALLLIASLDTTSAWAQTDVDGAFAVTAHPSPPHYVRRSDWAEWRGGTPGAPVDIFFVQPTTFVSKQWNQDLADTKTDAWTRATVATRQIGAFAACCRVYSPRYRQASSRAYSEMAGDGAKAYDLAYQDVRAAFLYYIAHENHGRPFVLVGHSQGALHVMRLLREEIDGLPLGKLLAVAYAPGIGVPIGTFGTELKTVVACDTPERTGCVASWNSFLGDADVTTYINRAAQSWTVEHGREGAELLCVNPLTFDLRRSAADAASNAGGIILPTAAEGPDAPIVPGAAGGKCDGGVLRVATAYAVTPLPGGSLHYYDIPLFWANLRANVAVRIAAFRRHR
jgi:hypothetical protein